MQQYVATRSQEYDKEQFKANKKNNKNSKALRYNSKNVENGSNCENHVFMGYCLCVQITKQETVNKKNKNLPFECLSLGFKLHKGIVSFFVDSFLFSLYWR